MAELVIGALVTVLFEKLASSDLIVLAQSGGIRSELKKWSDTLTQIQAVLVDAGRKHIRDRSVQLWLNELQHLAYEIDDVLDDLATEAARHQCDQESCTNTSKVLKFIPNKLHTLTYNRKMSSKLEEITANLLDLSKKKQLLGLTDKVERSVIASRRLETTSLIDESRIIGREGDKEALLRKLLDNEVTGTQTQNVNIVSVVGLGGIGKTTVAQLLYNDKKVKDHFDLMSWVCVSEDFNVFKISKAIFKDVGGDDRKFETLNQLQVAIREKVANKRFMLVLDDVWNENYKEWELLQQPFNVGSLGCKILVTTRKTKVASVMKFVKSYPLELLSNEDALSLLAQYALGKWNFDSHPKIKLHAEGIVKKCGGLPLALRTLGWVLSTKSNDDEWKKLLNSELWDSPNESNADLWNSANKSEVLTALKLSYYDLPAHLKQMFVYCCLFPKDYMFDKDELVLLWMAEGFLYDSNNNKSMESFGQECFEELVSRSFFQQLTHDKSRYTMHDLINDLATSVAGEFFHVLDDKMEVYGRIQDLEKCHHLSFIRDQYGAHKMLKGLKVGRRLRTFLPMSITRLGRSEIFSISNKVLLELLPQLYFLRVLSLAGYNITEIPKFVCNLKHLRYLNFSNTEITCLPEQVGDLHNLQSLLMSGCEELSSLPNSIIKLTNLRHLDISHTPKLNKMPLGLGGLTRLQTLSKVIIGGVGDYRISNLKGLLNHRGHLSIEGLQEVKDAVHTKDPNLQQMKGICDLHMKWSDVFDDSRNKETEYQVLEGLRPFEKLKSLKILYYGGIKFPSWIGDPSFVCLTQLTFRGCESCESIPTLGHLPSLEVLKFQDMKSWKEWSTSGGDVVRVFPCLREISIINCAKLDVVAMEIIPSLRVLHVEGCSLMVLRSMVGVSTSVVRLTIRNIRGLTQLHGGVLEKKVQSITEVFIDSCERLESYNCPSGIEKLVISDCCSLTSLSFPTMDDLPSPLKYLSISYCDKLEMSWLTNNYLSSLEHLSISYMPNLRLFPEGCLVHLTELQISFCDNIESIPDIGYGFLPYRCLRQLVICECKKLKSFPYEHLQSLASLGEMKIYKCPSLDYSFPCGLWPPNLSDLLIGGLKKPISEWGIQNFPTSLVYMVLDGFKNSSRVVSFEKGEKDTTTSTTTSSFFLLPSSLTYLNIYDFKELESVSEGLEHLTSLQHLCIWRSPKLRDLPETLLPSLLSLTLKHISPELEKKCTSRKGKYWPIVSQIPYHSVSN